jgi:hypothetical protein
VSAGQRISPFDAVDMVSAQSLSTGVCGNGAQTDASMVIISIPVVTNDAEYA